MVLASVLVFANLELAAVTRTASEPVQSGHRIGADAIAVLRALRTKSDRQLALRHHDSERYTAGIEAELSDERIQIHGGLGLMRE